MVLSCGGNEDMKVLIVATNREASPYPVAPTGVLCVTGAARATHHDVTFVDMGSAILPKHKLRSVLAKNDFQVVAMGIRNLDNCAYTAPYSYYGEVREYTKIIREHFSGPLILGGSGFSVSPEGWMKRLNADIGVVGEGERTFVEILSRLEENLPLENVDGVITAQNNSVAPTQTISELDEMPLAAHDLCHYSRYIRGGGFVGVQTKRGCPFKCTYCIYPQLEGRRYRLRAPEAVVDEVERVFRSAGHHHFFFVDSVFNDPRKHAIEVCRELIRRKLPIHWNAFCNPRGFDDELAHLMAEAGCNSVEFGLDVANDKMLRAMGKPFKQKDTRIALQAAYDAGLPFANFMLFGGPTETWEDVKDTQDFLMSCAPANAVFAVVGIRIYEKTPLAKIAADEGIIAPDQDLFEPTYYLSPAMAENMEIKLDRIARRDESWTSPIDWNRFVMRYGQKLYTKLNIRPQWRDLRQYGRNMRKQEI